RREGTERRAFERDVSKSSRLSFRGDPLLQALGHRLRALAASERHGRGCMTRLQRREDADSAGTGVVLECFLRGRFEGCLRLPHRGALRLRRLEIVSFRDGLDLRHLAGLMVHDDLGELARLRRVHGKLEFPVLDLELGRDRLAMLFRDLERLFERDLGGLESLEIDGLLTVADSRSKDQSQNRCSETDRPFHMRPPEIRYLVATFASAALIPSAISSGAPTPQKCMKNSLGVSRSMWEWSAVTSIPCAWSSRTTGLTSSATRTKSPVVATRSSTTAKLSAVPMPMLAGISISPSRIASARGTPI